MTTAQEASQEFDFDSRHSAGGIIIDEFSLLSPETAELYRQNRDAALGDIALIGALGEEAPLPPSPAEAHNNLWLRAVDTHLNEGRWNAFDAAGSQVSAFILAIYRGDEPTVIDKAELMDRAEELADRMYDAGSEDDDGNIAEAVVPSSLFKDWAIVANRFGELQSGASSDRRRSILSGGPEKLAVARTLYDLNEEIVARMRAMGATEKDIQAAFGYKTESPEDYPQAS